MLAIEAQQNQVYSPPDKRSEAEAVLAKIADPTRELAKLDRYEAALCRDASSRSANWTT